MFDSRFGYPIFSINTSAGWPAPQKNCLLACLSGLIPQNSGGDCPDVWSYHLKYLKNYPTTVNTTGRSATIGKKNYTQLLRKNNWSPKRLQLFHMLSGVVVFGRSASWWFNFFGDFGRTWQEVYLRLNWIYFWRRVSYSRYSVLEIFLHFVCMISIFPVLTLTHL
jgi:hypothetical protein